MCYARPEQYLRLLIALLYSQAASTEPRQSYSSEAPVWLHSVGKLTVPGYRMNSGRRLQQFENCSATLVAADRVITAWHCLEYYRDLSRDILFPLPHRQQDAPHRAVRLADGGGITDDWALLKLDRPIPTTVAQPNPCNSSRWQNSVYEQRGNFSHAARTATGAKATAFATERHQFLIMAGLTANPEKPMLQPAALQVLIKFPRDVGG
jgi:hypothetical protein